MGLYEHFPYTNFHDLNLDWLLQRIKELESSQGGGTLQKEYVTPEMFGGVGDGITDDTDALRQCFMSGKEIQFLENKTYVCSGTLDILTGTNLDGNGSTIKFTNTSDITNHTFLQGSSVQNVRLENLRLDGGTQSTLKYLLSFYNSEHITLDNVTALRGYGYAVRINDSSHVKIINSHGEDITGADTNPGGFIYGKNFKNLLVENCSCKNVYDHAVYVTGDSSEIIIDGCNFESCGTNTSTAGAAVVLYGNTTNFCVSNCNIKDSKSGIQLSQYTGIAQSPSNGLIIGNVIDGSTLNAITLGGASGKEVDTVFITGNKLIDSDQDGINMQYSDNIRISTNSIDGFGRNFLRFGNCDNVVVDGNIAVNGAGQNPLVDGYSGANDSPVIINNIFDESTATHCVYQQTLPTGSPIADGNRNNGTSDIMRYSYPTVSITLEAGFSALSTTNNMHIMNNMIIGNIGIRGFGSYNNGDTVGTFSKSIYGDDRIYMGVLIYSTSGNACGHWRVQNGELVAYIDSGITVLDSEDIHFVGFNLPLN